MTDYEEIRKALFGNPPKPPQPRQPTGADPFLKALQQAQSASRAGLPLVKAKPKPLVLPRKPRVFVSFDYENDVRYKRLLEAWNANSKFLFTFQDRTPQEIQSEDVGRVKAVLTAKVKEASHVLVLVGQYANERHADAGAIGCLNWIHFECQQAMEYKKKLVAVVLHPRYMLPSNIIGADGVRVDGFGQAAIIDALSRA